MNDIESFNKYNHADRGNPHPQYNAQKLYYTKHNPSNAVRYAKFFDANFQQNVNNFDLKDRQFNRLIMSAYVYSMDNENNQNMNMLNMYAIVMSNGELLLEVDGRNLLGIPRNEFIVAYKDVTSDDGKKQYNVRIYAKLQYAYERVKIQPLIFDPVSNYNTPFNLAAAKSGVNTYERCVAMFGNIQNNTLIELADMEAELDGYTQELCDLNYGFMKGKTLNLSATDPRIAFTSDSVEKAEIIYDTEKEGLYLNAKNNMNKFATDMNILPTKTNTTIGNAGSPWNVGFFNALGLKIYTSITDIPAGATMCILKIPTYTGLAYKDSGYWYTATGTAINR